MTPITAFSVIFSFDIIMCILPVYDKTVHKFNSIQFIFIKQCVHTYYVFIDILFNLIKNLLSPIQILLKTQYNLSMNKTASMIFIVTNIYF